MKFSELKVGQQVQDSWFLQWGIGRITILLKTRVVVKFPHDSIKYDKEHVKFLQEAAW